ncbi:hypothetical protein ACJX0J_036224 [Zea mays]
MHPLHVVSIMLDLLFRAYQLKTQAKERLHWFSEVDMKNVKPTFANIRLIYVISNMNLPMSWKMELIILWLVLVLQSGFDEYLDEGNEIEIQTILILLCKGLFTEILSN